MLNTNSIKYFFTVIYSKAWKNNVDFKSKNKANYKDTRITLTEAVLVPFSVVTLNMF